MDICGPLNFPTEEYYILFTINDDVVFYLFVKVSLQCPSNQDSWLYEVESYHSHRLHLHWRGYPATNAQIPHFRLSLLYAMLFAWEMYHNKNYSKFTAKRGFGWVQY